MKRRKVHKKCAMHEVGLAGELRSYLHHCCIDCGDNPVFGEQPIRAERRALYRATNDQAMTQMRKSNDTYGSPGKREKRREEYTGEI
ncbi:hypothetical protein RRG08_016981 [Elysia crispata]|uniref:Uncharacterized protein n=1 Tax=Elysia crispata TaxID=231223 RepID=A0AAE0XYR0_9GAST|nr:hypothetical protein RRG08_016981 [Elysia crispata]